MAWETGTFVALSMGQRKIPYQRAWDGVTFYVKDKVWITCRVSDHPCVPCLACFQWWAEFGHQHCSSLHCANCVQTSPILTVNHYAFTIHCIIRKLLEVGSNPSGVLHVTTLPEESITCWVMCEHLHQDCKCVQVVKSNDKGERADLWFCESSGSVVVTDKFLTPAQ